MVKFSSDEHEGEMGTIGDALERDLAALADQLPILLPSDLHRPSRWFSDEFGRQVATVRSAVTTIADGRDLARHLEPANTGTGIDGSERAARRLASDATAVALAIRWLEIEADIRLPSWSEILRRRTLFLFPGRLGSVDASAWFG
jgi:hypothetical protein